MSDLIAVRAFIPYRDGFVFVRRSNSSTNNGLWELPGGKVDHGQTSLEAAVAETEQETGLIIEPVLGPFSVNEYLISDGKHAGQHYRSVCVLGRVIGGELIQETAETSAAECMPADQALDRLNLTANSRQALMQLGQLSINY
jgi:8-oxo-dGTP pyrophosphatase MutT (NUDIX family)